MICPAKVEKKHSNGHNHILIRPVFGFLLDLNLNLDAGPGLPDQMDMEWVNFNERGAKDFYIKIQNGHRLNSHKKSGKVKLVAKGRYVP